MDFVDLAVKVSTGALGGACASLFLAGYVAQSQERGKLRAADLDKLRALVAEQLSYLAMYWHQHSVTKSYPNSFLSGTARDEAALELVQLAYRLSRRKQRRIRQRLVVIFGELTVACSEELAMAPDRRHTHMSRSEAWKGAALSALQRLGDKAMKDGSLRAFADSPADASKYEAARRDFEALLRVVGGHPGLVKD